MLKKSFKRDLLLLLAKGVNFWDSYLSYSAQSYHLYFDRWKKSTVYSNISQLLKVGDIEKVIKNEKPYLRLTSQGDEKLHEDIPFLALSKKPWDKIWRIVAFDIPEKQRRKRISLRNKLITLGFGQWQKSVYISPYDFSEEVNEFLKYQKLFKMAVCLKAKRLSQGDDRDIANKAWRLDQLSEKYEKFISECQKFEQRMKESHVKKENLNAIIEEFIDLLENDPFLPQELLPLNWLFKKAGKKFRYILSLTQNLF